MTAARHAQVKAQRQSNQAVRQAVRLSKAVSHKSAVKVARRVEQKYGVSPLRTSKLAQHYGDAGFAKAAIEAKPPKPASYKPQKFYGVKTAGTPSLGELRKARKALVRGGKGAPGALRVSEPKPGKRFLVTPRVARASRAFKREKAKARKARPTIAGITHGPTATRFAEVLAKETGISPQAIGAWVQSEGGGESGSSGGGAGLNNWLGVGYPAERTPFSDSAYFNGSPEKAAKATADWMKGKLTGVPGYDYTASSGIQEIIPKAAHKGPAAFVQALAESGWGTDTSAVATNLSMISASKASGPAAKHLRGARKEALNVGLQIAKQKPGPGAEKPKGLPKGSSRYFVKGDGSEHLRFVPVFAKQLIKLAKASGEPIVVNSGFRTYSEQQASYQDYLEGGNLAAVPGTSNHEFGLAADLELSEKQRGMLSQFGLGLPVAGEDWHVEITDPKLREKAGYDSPGSVNTTSFAGSTGSLSGLGGAAATGAPETYAGAAIEAAQARPEEAPRARAEGRSPEQIFAFLKRLGVPVGGEEGVAREGPEMSVLKAIQQELRT